MAEFAVEFKDLLQRISGGDDVAETQLLDLRDQYPEPLAASRSVLLQTSIYYPAELYQGPFCPQLAAQALTAIELHLDPFDRSNLLCVLAELGSSGAKNQAIVQQFAKWRERAPAWSEQLDSETEEYPHEAGWELDGRGRRRDLCCEPFQSLVSGAQLPEESQQSCRGCDGQLHDLLGDGRLCCVDCCCFVDQMGLGRAATWSRHPQQSPMRHRPLSGQAEQLPTRRLQVAKTSRQSIRPFGEKTPHSWLGGRPAWADAAQFPQCPDCRESMFFIGQLDARSLGEPQGAGCYYSFACPCKDVHTFVHQVAE